MQGKILGCVKRKGALRLMRTVESVNHRSACSFTQSEDSGKREPQISLFIHTIWGQWKAWTTDQPVHSHNLRTVESVNHRSACSFTQSEDSGKREPQISLFIHTIWGQWKAWTTDQPVHSHNLRTVESVNHRSACSFTQSHNLRTVESVNHRSACSFTQSEDSGKREPQISLFIHTIWGQWKAWATDQPVHSHNLRTVESVSHRSACSFTQFQDSGKREPQISLFIHTVWSVHSLSAYRIL